MRHSLRLDDAAGTGDSCGGVAERRRRIEQRFVDRPFIQFDDGTVVPVGIPDAVHGTIECCQAAHNGQDETSGQRRQRIGNALGRFFEARIRQLCHGLGNSYLVIGSDVIDEVMDREAGRDSKRADVVVGDSYGCYMVLEATKRNLRLGIRYGDQEALDSWADEHLRKYKQAQSTADHLHAITAACDAPSPRNVACVVVGDLPLRQDVGLSAQSSMLDPADASRRSCAASPNSRCSSNSARLASLSRRSCAHGNTPAPTCRWVCTSPTIRQLEADVPMLEHREPCPEGFGQRVRPIEQMMWGGAISVASGTHSSLRVWRSATRAARLSSLCSCRAVAIFSRASRSRGR